MAQIATPVSTRLERQGGAGSSDKAPPAVDMRAIAAVASAAPGTLQWR
jgi:hypothetical protein